MDVWGDRRGRAAAAVLMVTLAGLLPACGGYTAHSAAARDTTTTTASVGSGVSIPTRAAATSSPSSARPGAGAATATTGSPTNGAGAAARGPIRCPNPQGRPTPLNVETRDDPIGLRLTVTVGDKICYQFGEEFTVAFDVTNISDHTIEYDTYQLTHFSVTPTAGGKQWHDHACGKYERRPDDARPNTGPFALDPNEKVSFGADYPGDAETSKLCGGQRGEQRVTGFITICTPGAPNGDDCEPGRTRLSISSPVSIRIG
jgi:hypothetical protein